MTTAFSETVYFLSARLCSFGRELGLADVLETAAKKLRRVTFYLRRRLLEELGW